jgi:hypothetical protein
MTVNDGQSAGLSWQQFLADKDVINQLTAALENTRKLSPLVNQGCEVE